MNVVFTIYTIKDLCLWSPSERRRGTLRFHRTVNTAVWENSERCRRQWRAQLERREGNYCLKQISHAPQFRWATSVPATDLQVTCEHTLGSDVTDTSPPCLHLPPKPTESQFNTEHCCGSFERPGGLATRKCPSPPVAVPGGERGGVGWRATGWPRP